jgi:hypothetical protein
MCLCYKTNKKTLRFEVLWPTQHDGPPSKASWYKAHSRRMKLSTPRLSEPRIEQPTEPLPCTCGHCVYGGWQGRAHNVGRVGWEGCGWGQVVGWDFSRRLSLRPQFCCIGFLTSFFLWKLMPRTMPLVLSCLHLMHPANFTRSLFIPTHFPVPNSIIL